MTSKEKDEILTTIAQIPLSEPTMDSTRNLILLYLAERLECDNSENDK
jgi:hypothetical protein